MDLRGDSDFTLIFTAKFIAAVMGDLALSIGDLFVVDGDAVGVSGLEVVSWGGVGDFDDLR